MLGRSFDIGCSKARTSDVEVELESSSSRRRKRWRRRRRRANPVVSFRTPTRTNIERQQLRNTQQPCRRVGAGSAIDNVRGNTWSHSFSGWRGMCRVPAGGSYHQPRGSKSRGITMPCHQEASGCTRCSQLRRIPHMNMSGDQ